MVALLAAGCVPPSPAPSAVATPSAGPPAAGPLPDGDPTRSQVLLRNADGRFDAYGSIGRLDGARQACTAVLLDLGPSGSGPAFAVTSGHCVGVEGANEVVVDRAAVGMAVAFDWFVDVDRHRVVPVVRLAWASMKRTDLAILELDATPDELRALGLRGWAPASVPDGGGPLDVAIVGAPVGAPLAEIPADERYLRLATCGLDRGPVAVVERQWLWTGSLRTDCPEVLPGNSGSALLDRATGGLVGIVNTTTHLGDELTACWLGRPCEVTASGAMPLPDASYGQPVAGLEACLAGGELRLGGACPLDPGTGVVSLEGALLSVNPAAPDPVDGEAGRRTWRTTVVTDGAGRYRHKVGPLGSTSCAEDAGYGDPRPVAEPVDDRLPTTEQRLLLCVVAEGQAVDTAAAAVVAVDTTPPGVPLEFEVTGGRDAGWRVAPVFVPPELSLFRIKAGPAATTDCDDGSGYAVYRRRPLAIGGRAAPARVCAIGYDDARNPTAPASLLLD